MLKVYANADSFQTLNALPLVSRNSFIIINNAVQDDDFIYWLTLNPVTCAKINKTEMATPRWTNASVPTLLSIEDTITAALLDEGSESIFLQGPATTYRISTIDLTGIETLPGEELNSLTGFMTYSNGVSTANFVGYATSQAIAQIRIVDPIETSLFDTPFKNMVASAYSQKNDIAILATYMSKYGVYKWNAKELLQTFCIVDLISHFVAYDDVNDILYTCGDYLIPNSGYYPVLMRFELSNIQNGSTISLSLSVSSFN